MELFGKYDVAVAGAGVTGIVASVAAAREGARTLLVESSGLLGGLITGGLLTKATGIVQPGVFRDLIARVTEQGGGDLTARQAPWGTYTGVFDPELMQGAIIEEIERAGVEVLLYSHVIDVLKSGDRVEGLVCQSKSGPQLVLANAFVDTTGDGDVAAASGARFQLGRDGDGMMQPMTTYFRIINVDYEGVVRDCQEHPDDVNELVLPQGPAASLQDYTLVFYMKGFAKRVALAKSEGFDWIVPKDYIVIKAGMLPGEINVNVTRYQGNALDPRTRSAAVIDLRKQAYCTFEFLRRYVGGFADAHLLDVSPTLGVRETRRIVGDYVLSEDDVLGQARFPDAIGLSNAPMDIHEPGGAGGLNISTGQGYGIPYGALLPAGVDGLLLGGRCISADHRAFGSTRNTPPCAISGQAAGVAAALAARSGVTPRQLPVGQVQDVLQRTGVVLGTSEEDVLEESIALIAAGHGTRI